jgi:coproporphyrinogen III oxidase-like Fe-S oxidoreductase
MSIVHVKYDFETLREIVAKAIKDVPNIVCTMNTMKKTTLNDEAKKELATAVVKIRKEIDDDKKFEIDEKTVMDILLPVRKEDEGDDLWSVFNVCQEKLIKGGYKNIGKNNKTRKQRGITSIKKDLEYNQRLWETAMNYLPATMAA